MMDSTRVIAVESEEMEGLGYRGVTVLGPVVNS